MRSLPLATQAASKVTGASSRSRSPRSVMSGISSRIAPSPSPAPIRQPMKRSVALWIVFPTVPSATKKQAITRVDARPVSKVHGEIADHHRQRDLEGEAGVFRVGERIRRQERRGPFAAPCASCPAAVPANVSSIARKVREIPSATGCAAPVAVMVTGSGLGPLGPAGRVPLGGRRPPPKPAACARRPRRGTR